MGPEFHLYCWVLYALSVGGSSLGQCTQSRYLHTRAVFEYAAVSMRKAHTPLDVLDALGAWNGAGVTCSAVQCLSACDVGCHRQCQ